MAAKYDLLVIGSGPGGYVAAIRGARLGLKTGIVERESLGGVCLNWGCIPTKALLESAHLLEKIRHADRAGLRVSGVEPDFPAIIERSRAVAGQMSKGVDYLMRKNGIDVIRGHASFADSATVVVKGEAGEQQIEARRFIVAVGARARNLPGLEIDEDRIVSYRKAMLLESAPGRLCVVGAGAIGIEYSDFYHSLGSEITILEVLPRILPVEDEEISAHLEKTFRDRGIIIHTGAKVLRADKKKDSIDVIYQNGDGQEIRETFDRMLLATGIEANTADLNLESVHVDLDRDRIRVNRRFQSSNPAIYAIGDCIPGPALAHVASHEGIHAAEAVYLSLRESSVIKTGPDLHFAPMNYEWVPSCTYCRPEVASAGMTERSAKEQGREILVGRFPFRALGRARASGESEGFVKVIVDRADHRLLGIHIVGANATEILSEGVVAAEGELLADTLARTIHAHPTLSEGVMEAAAEAIGEAINI